MKATAVVLFAIALCSSTAFSQYTGTGSVSQGAGTIFTKDLYVCSGGRPTNIGRVNSTNGRTWFVPAAVKFANAFFPPSLDLHNTCTGVTYATTAAARAAYANGPFITVDADGEMITAYVFADNYFEMYVNGIPVGKDNVPYTPFNSSVVRFRAKRPFTVAVRAVDWEENLGLGTEVQGQSKYHAGDAGVVIAFMDESNTIIATTSPEWKAQTFYTSPIQDLSCLKEEGTLRSSKLCSTADAADGSQHYAVFWDRPAGWENADFDDSSWPNAFTYSNNEVGVDNKPAYTNFTDVFDAAGNDATFIWTSNLVLDNDVILRYRVPGTTSVGSTDSEARDEYTLFELFTLNGVHIGSGATSDALKMIESTLPTGPYLRVERSTRGMRSSIVLVH